MSIKFGKTIQKQKQFTLIELLVVVAIILILISLIQPALRRTIEQAKILQCLNQLRNIGITAINYSSDHDDTFPDRLAQPGMPSMYAGGLHNDGIINNFHWGESFVDYMDNIDFHQYDRPKTFYCPSNTNDGETWRPPYQENWRLSDYAIWPSLADSIDRYGLTWVSKYRAPAKLNQATPHTPLTGDALFRFQLRSPKEWWVSSHPIDGIGVNSYARHIQSEGEQPNGGNQVNYDGSGGWHVFEDFEMAADMTRWGSALGAQFWVTPEGSE